MKQQQETTNLATRVGGWSAGHCWKTAVFLWLAFVIGAVVVGGAAGTKQTPREDMNVGEARRADHLLQKTGLRFDPQTEYVIVQSATLPATAPAFRAAISDVLEAIRPYASTYSGLRSPYADPKRQISADGRTAFVEFTMKGDHEAAVDRIDPIVAATERVQRAHPELYVGQAGAASTGKAIEQLVTKQLEDAGVRSVPFTLLVLFVVFGAAVAAVIPVLLALSAVIAALGLLGIFSHFVPMDQNVSVVVLLIGLAVGVDYSLFYLKRRRDERRAGADGATALSTAAATSGRTILVSGATVLIAMAGMLFSGDTTFMSFSIGTMTVVAVTVVGSLTVLPASIARLGDKVDRGRIPYLSRALTRRRGGDGVWARIAESVMRHPLAAGAAAVAVLAALALPALGLRTAQSGLDMLPADTPELTALRHVDTAFPGDTIPTEVVVDAPAAPAPQLRAAIAKLGSRALRAGVTERPVQTELNATGTGGRIDVALVGDGLDEKSQNALLSLRHDILPQTLGQVAGAEYAVGGLTAASHDYGTTMKRALPLVFVFVLGFAFLLLLASFRSLVIATTAIAMNLMSVAAAYGALVLTFQHTWAENLLGFSSNGAIAHWLPLFLFVILFGLSMDYHVFILSRIREAFDRGLRTEDAVAHGIRSTAGVVTSAAIVMVGAFSLFATMPLRDMKEMGIGLAVAVLIDATIVRAVLLPAVMTLLGDRNWYLPRWLEWLPRIDHGSGDAADRRLDARLVLGARGR